MPVDGEVLRAWRRSYGWDVPETARRLRRAAGDDHVPVHDALVRMVRRWEREGLRTERYELLYAAAFEIDPDRLGGGPPGKLIPSAAATDPVIRDEHSRDVQQATLLQASLADLMSTDRDLAAELAHLTVGGDLVEAAEHFAFCRTEPIRAGDGLRRIEMWHVTQMQNTTAIFRQWDNKHGGGLRRKAVIGQLNEVSALLPGPFADEKTGRHFLSAAADLAQLAGWMSYDLQMHTTAQHYYLLGMRAAKHAGDLPQVARMFYCAARQMVDLGRQQDALDLAAAGLYAIRRRPVPKAAAMLHVITARAHACLGDATQCSRELGAAQEIFTQPGEVPAWCAFFDDAELCGLVGVTLRDLAIADTERSTRHATAARPWIERAIASRPSEYLRSKVLDLDGLAVITLLLREPYAAAELAMSAVALAQGVTSSRIGERLARTVRLAEQRFPQVQVWRELDEQVRALPHG